MLSNRLMKHFGAAAAAATVVGAANAAIVWSGAVNLDIPVSTNGLYLNVVNGANNLPAPGGAGGTVPGWDINPWSSSTLNFFNPTNPSGGVYVRASGTSGVSNLAPSALISSASTWSSGTAQTTGANAFVFNSSNNIVGFRFNNEATSTLHYGWFRISLGATLTSPRAVVEYAYESVAGVGIAAGAIPAPSALALLGLAGLAGRRRR